MSRLILFRHGKSDWDAGAASDHARPLNRRGRAAARRMGVFLARVGEAPDRVITSSALRARDSVALAAEAGGWACPVEETDALYGASRDSALALVQGCDSGSERLLLAGHEPTWSELAGALMDGVPPRMPTAAMICFELDLPWREVRFGDGRLVWHVTPKLLGKLGFDVPDAGAG